MPADVARDFAATRRVADVDRVPQLQPLDEGREVIGVRIQVVAVPRLAGAAMTSPVMSDAAVTARCQEEHLIFKGICAERPAVAEDHGLPGAQSL